MIAWLESEIAASLALCGLSFVAGFGACLAFGLWLGADEARQGRIAARARSVAVFQAQEEVL